MVFKPFFHPNTTHEIEIAIDSQRMQQVTLNLLTNALKFTRKGGNIELGGEILTENGEKFVMVYVQDDGDGIAAEDKPKLFKLFGKLK